MFKLKYKKTCKYKLVRYLKVVLNKKYILIIVLSALISNTYLLYLNSKYNSFYKCTPDIIQAQAVVFRWVCGKRIYEYVCNKN